MSFSTQLGLMPDARTAFFPNDSLWNECKKGEKQYPVPHSHYYEIILAENFSCSLSMDEPPIRMASIVCHVKERITLSSPHAIDIDYSTILAAKHITLEAPLIRIYDDTKNLRSIRTTVIATETLMIRAGELLLAGVDLLPAPSCQVEIGTVTFFGKPTKNIEWLETVPGVGKIHYRKKKDLCKI